MNAGATATPVAPDPCQGADGSRRSWAECNTIRTGAWLQLDRWLIFGCYSGACGRTKVDHEGVTDVAGLLGQGAWPAAIVSDLRDSFPCTSIVALVRVNQPDA